MYNPHYEKDTILDGSSYKTPTEISYSTDPKILEEGAYRETLSKAQSPFRASLRNKSMGNMRDKYYERSCAYFASDWNGEIYCSNSSDIEGRDKQRFETRVSRINRVFVG